MKTSSKFIKNNDVIGLIFVTLFVLCVCALKNSNGESCGDCFKTYDTLDCSQRGKTTIICDTLESCNLQNLKYFNFSNNELKKFDDPDVHCLINKFEVFIFSHNKMTKFIDGIYTAKEVDISDNKLTGYLNLFQFTYLTYLNASDNKLENIDCGKELIVLDVTRNNIKSIQNCNSLQELRASTNRLENWEIIQQLEHLIFLDVSNNLFRVSPKVWNFPSNLTTLILSNNMLTNHNFSEFKNLCSLEVLDLSSTSLDSIPSLQLTSNVKQINLSNNTFRDVDIKTLENLIVDDNCSSVISVDLRNNHFSRKRKGIREIVFNPMFVTNAHVLDSNCSCVNVTTSCLELIFCVNDAEEEEPCWWEEDMVTTTPTTTPKASTTASSTQSDQTTEEQKQSMIDSGEKNETRSSNERMYLSHAAYFLQSFGAAKLSFLGFLLLTLIVLIIINCIVGDPVVDDYWWEEKQPSDRPVT